MISIRLDSDLVTWFREHFTEGYQTKMNQVLRSFLTEEHSRRDRLIGRDGDGKILVSDWASWAQTIPHEITCLLGPRVRRVAVD